MAKLDEFAAAMTVHLSPCGRGRIASSDAIRVRGISPRITLPFASADADPSSGADFVRVAFSHKGRRKKFAAELFHQGSHSI
jgi:hypothetical protein